MVGERVVLSMPILSDGSMFPEGDSGAENMSYSGENKSYSSKNGANLHTVPTVV